MVRDAVYGDAAAAVDGAGRDREADPGGDVRVQGRPCAAHGRSPGCGSCHQALVDGSASVTIWRILMPPRGSGSGDEARRPGPGGRAGLRRQAARLEHRQLGEQGPPHAGGAPAARAVELVRPRRPGVPHGRRAWRRAGDGRRLLRQPRERRPRDSRLVHGQAERGEPGWRPFQRGKRPTAVPRAPQRGGPAVGAREPDQAAQRWRAAPARRASPRAPGRRSRAAALRMQRVRPLSESELRARRQILPTLTRSPS